MNRSSKFENLIIIILKIILICDETGKALTKKAFAEFDKVKFH